MRFNNFLLLFLACLGLSNNLSAQTTPPSYIPTVIPPSPTASALMKFTDVPVSPYTGTADISVPIYTIQVKGLTVPIDLNYHTGGIRLSEEASHTGLGWALNAGGMISRTINDRDDLGGLYTTNIPQPEGDLSDFQPANGPLTTGGSSCDVCSIVVSKYIFDFNCSYQVHFNNPLDSIADFSVPFEPMSGSAYDLEPDSYNFNFLGRGGKFIITRDGKIIQEKQSNLRIEKISAGGNPTFLITDENGNKFYFFNIETGGLSSAPNTISSWHLSRIITQQNEVINFTYGDSGSPYNNVASAKTQTYSISCGDDGQFDSSNSGYTYANVDLQSIDYTTGRLVFSTDNARTDLQGGTKLNKVTIYSKTTAGLKYQKEFALFYSYFNPGTNYELQRLRLDSVKESSGTTKLKPYTFLYNAAPAVYGEKHGYSMDHWGYYNGLGNTVMIPTTNIIYDNQGTGQHLFSYSGANRNAIFPAMQCFSLQRITYPTGGYSTLDYAANTYDDAKSSNGQINPYPNVTITAMDTILQIQPSTFGGATTISGTFDLSKIYPLRPTGSVDPNATISIAFISTSNQGWSSADRNTFGKLYFSDNGNITDISSSSLVAGGPALSTSHGLVISPELKSFPWSAHFEPSYIPASHLSLIRVTVSYQGATTVVNNNPTLTGGGLRVNTIATYNSDGSIAKKRRWDYTYGATGQFSFGKLMAQPSYIHSEFTRKDLGTCPTIYLVSNSNTNLTSTIGGNIVGYSQVTEYVENASTQEKNGKTVYNYINTVDTTLNYGTLRLPGIPNLGNNLNGSLLSQIIYKLNGTLYQKVTETQNFYHAANKKLYFSAKYRPSTHENPGGVCYTGQGVPNQGQAFFFPSIKSERVLQDSTRNIVYDESDTTQSITTVSKNFYDNPVHYQLTRNKTTDSRKNTHVTKTTYPQDYITTGNYTGNLILDSLIRRNMVATTIEQRDSFYYAGYSTGYIRGATQTRYKRLSSGTMVPDKIFKLDLTRPVTAFQPMAISGNTYTQDSRYRQLISFDTYDSANNIAQYTASEALPVSIIWDYRQTSTIAQVKGASLANTAYTSFEAESLGNWTTITGVRDSVTIPITGIKSLTLGSMTKTGLTAATTYVVSYWKNSATPLTITGTISGYPITGSTFNGWTYFEHKITGQTTITLSGTGKIDEVRLYPQDAQMTSYTYSPLNGLSSENDARAGIRYYEYDIFQRLKTIKDQAGNILKLIDYHYQNQ